MRRARCDHVDEALPVRQVGPQHEVVRSARPQLEHTRVAVDDHRSPVDAAGDLLRRPPMARAAK